MSGRPPRTPRTPRTPIVPTPTRMSSTYRHPASIGRPSASLVPEPKTAEYLLGMESDPARLALARALLLAVEAERIPWGVVEPYRADTWLNAPLHRRKEWAARVVATADPALLARLRGFVDRRAGQR